MFIETPEVALCTLLNMCKLQSIGSNLTGMATSVRLVSHHIVVAHDDSVLYHSELPLPHLGIPVVLVSRHRGDTKREEELLKATHRDGLFV